VENRNSSGFTIVELLIVVVVVAILASLAIVSYNGITSKARDVALASSLEQVAKKIAARVVSSSDGLPANKDAFLLMAGISQSGSMDYQYAINTAVNPQIYCITATSVGVSGHIAGFSDGTVNQYTPGPCVMPGVAEPHTGNAPTVAANGEPCPTNFIVVPGSSIFSTGAFCVAKYETKIQGNDNGNQVYTSTLVPSVRAGGSPWVSISQTNAIAEASSLCDGCHLMSDSEWMTLAANVLSVGGNWSSGSVGSGYFYQGHVRNYPSEPIAASTNDGDSLFGLTGDIGAAGYNNRRTLTLSNGAVVWDVSGNVAEWTTTVTTKASQQPGLASDNTNGTSYSWKEWNAVGIQRNQLSIFSTPAVLSYEATQWGSAQGVGRIWSNQYSGPGRALIRGGYHGDNSSVGVLMIHFGYLPNHAPNIVGFRIAR